MKCWRALFYNEKTDEIKRKILSKPLHFPGLDIVLLLAKDILTKFLNRNPEERLGVNRASEIKAYLFFQFAQTSLAGI